MWADFASGMGMEVRANASKFGRHNSPTKGAHKGGEGTHKGRPYPIQAALRGFVPI